THALVFARPLRAGTARGPNLIGSWSQCMRKNEKGFSMNRPTPDPSQEGSERSSAPVPLLGGVRGGFMVLMHAKKRRGYHEPLVAGPILCYICNKVLASRFMAPMRAKKASAWDFFRYSSFVITVSQHDGRSLQEEKMRSEERRVGKE